MRIFYDFEFLENGISIKPISVGMVADNGDKYYAIVDDMELMERAYAHTWLRKHVLNQLPLYLDDDGDLVWDRESPDFKHVKPKWQIAEDIKHFITNVPKAELWAYYAAYDHVCLAQLFGTMVSLPAGIPMFTHELMQEMERYPLVHFPEQSGGLHNALEDAEWNKSTMELIDLFRRLDETPREPIPAVSVASPKRTRVW